MTMRSMTVYVAMIALPAILFPGGASAEGNCPAGSYPIGGGSAGWVGCAPIAGGANDQGPEERWETRWGAIAIGDGYFGAAEGASSKDEAENTAMQRCLSTSNGEKCWVKISYSDQCAALAWGDGGVIAFRSPDKDDAERSAVSSCSKHTTHCKVFYSGCSYPRQGQ